MDRVCFIGFVDETHHCLGAIANLESRSWCHAIIANEPGLAQIWVDLPSD